MSNVSGAGPPRPHSEPRAPLPAPPEPASLEPAADPVSVTPPEPGNVSGGPEGAGRRRRRLTADGQEKPKSKLPSVAATPVQ